MSILEALGAGVKLTELVTKVLDGKVWTNDDRERSQTLVDLLTEEITRLHGINESDVEEIKKLQSIIVKLNGEVQ